MWSTNFLIANSWLMAVLPWGDSTAYSMIHLLQYKVSSYINQTSVLEISLDKELIVNCLVETHTKLGKLILVVMVLWGQIRVPQPFWLTWILFDDLIGMVLLGPQWSANICKVYWPQWSADICKVYWPQWSTDICKVYWPQWSTDICKVYWPQWSTDICKVYWPQWSTDICKVYWSLMDYKVRGHNAL